MTDNASPPCPGRRRFIGAAAAVAAGAALPRLGQAHGIGAVYPPLPMPASATVIRQDGARLPLSAILGGRLTALQLMFTGCSQTCPLQGALFAEVQAGLPQLKGTEVRLLSVSIDPFDDSKRLAAWLGRHGAGTRWSAAVPVPRDIDAITGALRQRADAGLNHATQVYFIDPLGRLIWRSEELPPARVVLGILGRIVAA